MRDVTSAIILRILFILAFCLKQFSLLYYGPGPYNTFEFSITTILFLTIVLLIIQQRKHMKNNEGRLVFHGHIVPEFNPKNERENEASGEAYKIAFSAMVVISILMIFVSTFFLLFEFALQPLFLLVGIGFIPIAGLMAYYFTYRSQYVTRKRQR